MSTPSFGSTLYRTSPNVAFQLAPATVIVSYFAFLLPLVVLIWQIDLCKIVLQDPVTPRWQGTLLYL